MSENEITLKVLIGKSEYDHLKQCGELSFIFVKFLTSNDWYLGSGFRQLPDPRFQILDEL